METPDMNDRRNRPCIRITSIWGGNSVDGLPPKDVCKKAAMACSQLLAMLGFTENAISIGLLGRTLSQEQLDVDMVLLDSSKFEEQANHIDQKTGKKISDKETRTAAANKQGEEKISSSKISVEDMLKGINLNTTKEEK